MVWNVLELLLVASPTKGDALSVRTGCHAHGAAARQLVLVLVAQLPPPAFGIEKPHGWLEYPIGTVNEQLTEMAGEPSCAPVAGTGAQARKLSVARVGLVQLVVELVREKFACQTEPHGGIGASDARIRQADSHRIAA